MFFFCDHLFGSKKYFSKDKQAYPFSTRTFYTDGTLMGQNVDFVKSLYIKFNKLEKVKKNGKFSRIDQ